MVCHHLCSVAGASAVGSQTASQQATVPVLEPSGVSGGLDVEQAGPIADESTAVVESPAKKPRVSVRRVGDEDYDQSHHFQGATDCHTRVI